MKRLIKLSVLLVMVITSNMLFAQKSAEEKAKMVTTKLNEKLAFSPEQFQKVNEIYTQHFNNVNALREQNKTASKEQKMKLMKEQWKSTDLKVKEVLTDIQKPKYEEAKKEAKQALRKRAGKKGKKAKITNNDGVEELLDDEAY